MPWTETRPVIEREKFVADARSGHWTMTELCAHYGVSRKTGYKMLKRYEEEGWNGLEDQRRAPKHCPHRMSEAVEGRLLEVKKRFPTWGARKVRAYLLKQEDGAGWPAESTINALFKRHGLVARRRRRPQRTHPGRPYVETSAPNDVWTADFKGQFRTKNHIYCYPLTVADLHSRYLLGCKGLLSTEHQGSRQYFEYLFRRNGLPRAILTDNGGPFCAWNAIQGLSRLGVWWLQLGIRHLRTQPSSPQQNGAHERMHRTLKAETTKPPANNLTGQQRKFDAFRRVYNLERPHEALENDTPAERWEPSPRPYPKTIKDPEYPEHYKVRLVSTGGHFRFDSDEVHLARALEGFYVGLEEVDDGVWDIYFYDALLARMDERDKRVVA